MKILVTGVAGFIGFHLSKKLLEEGHDIVGIDNITHYYDPKLKLLRLSLLSSNKFQFFELDINEIDSLNQDFDLVINLAAQAGVRLSKINKNNYLHSNVNGFKQVVKFCIDNSIDKVVYASSSSVYDDSLSNAFSERSSNLNPKSFYGETKLFNEEYIESINSSIDFIGLRFFSVYGPYGRPDMAYYLFADSICKDKTIRLHNKGLMARDMTYIADAVDGIMRSIEYLKENKGCSHQIFNIGNDNPVKTYRLLQLIESILDKKAKITNVDVLNESIYTHADLTRSREILGYNPEINLQEGMQEFIKWYKKYENF